MNISMSAEKFLTKDIHEAAALLASNIKLLQLDQEKQFSWFVFKNENDNCQQLSNAYWSGELQISAKAYATALKDLKDRLFAQKQAARR